MATNASTWFYTEPEHRPYLIEERVNHTFWSNRINGLHFKCTRAEPPFQMRGMWHHIPVTLEWTPKDSLTLSAPSSDGIDPLLVGIKEILGFMPTISYVDPSGQFFAEWHVEKAEERVQKIQGNPNYHQIRRYKK